MSQQLREELVRRLKGSYSAYYDVEPVEDGTPLKARCAYHQRDSRYVLSKRAELWAAECHEYLYLWSVDRLDLETEEAIFSQTLAQGEPLVRPHPQHMSTYLTALVFYDSADPAALARLKKRKKRKEYKLSLHGWMEVRIAAVEVSTVGLTTNPSGKSLAKDLKRLVEQTVQQISGEEQIL